MIILHLKVLCTRMCCGERELLDNFMWFSKVPFLRKEIQRNHGNMIPLNFLSKLGGVSLGIPESF